MSARPAAIPASSRASEAPGHATDWVRVASLVHASRALDDIEETRLLPERKVLYQFSARGHDLAQILLGLQLWDAHDGVSVYYRSRPLMLALGGRRLRDRAVGLDRTCRRRRGLEPVDIAAGGQREGGA